MMCRKTNRSLKEFRAIGRKIALLAMLLALVLAISAGCSSGSKSADTAASNEMVQGAASNKASTASSSGVGFDSAKEAATEQKADALPEYDQNKTSIGAGEAGLPVDRKLIYHANSTMEVADYAQASAKIRDLIVLSGGYILQFNETQSLYERGGMFVIKVPSQGFFSFIEGLRKISPKTFQPNVQGQDVTEEYVDLESRLKAKQTVEARLLEFMEKASNSDSLLKFSKELAAVQEEIEQIKGRMRYIDRNVAYSTIELRVHEQTKAQVLNEDKRAPALERAGKALESSLRGIARFFTGLFVFLAGALPILLLLTLIAAPFVIWWRKYTVKRPHSTPSNHNSAADDKKNTDPPAEI